VRREVNTIEFDDEESALMADALRADGSTMPDWRRIEADQAGLAIRSVRHLGEGWTAHAYLVNDEFVFRVPKRAEHWAEIEREIAFLNYAADLLPLPVPRYITVVPVSSATPHGYAVSRYLRGCPLDVAALSPERQAAAAHTLGDFLRVMHSLEPPAEMAARLPHENARLQAEEYYERVTREIAPKLTTAEAQAVIACFEEYLTTPANFAFRPVVLHADLSCDHILMESGSIVGLIDFGDVSWGDPDYDFMYLFAEIGWDFVHRIARAYGHSRLEQLRRRVEYYYVLDLASTILDGDGYALEGQQEASWAGLGALRSHHRD